VQHLPEESQVEAEHPFVPQTASPHAVTEWLTLGSAANAKFAEMLKVRTVNNGLIIFMSNSWSVLHCSPVMGQTSRVNAATPLQSASAMPELVW
jgi:hypothetical protein